MVKNVYKLLLTIFNKITFQMILKHLISKMLDRISDLEDNQEKTDQSNKGIQIFQLKST